MNNNYRYQLERYRGRGSRYTCPQCGRKQSFTRYIDTYNIYINDNVGKCNRLDKCGYHYTPKQYFTDKEWKSDGWLVGRKHRETDQPTTNHTSSVDFLKSFNDRCMRLITELFGNLSIAHPLLAHGAHKLYTLALWQHFSSTLLIDKKEADFKSLRTF